MVNCDNVISIGWDAGGWMGEKHGFSICKWNSCTDSFEWIGQPIEISMPRGDLFSLDYIFQKIKNLKRDDFMSNSKVVISIDAPLGFPSEYVRFVNGELICDSRPDKEIDSRLAYRDTERHIYEMFNKKPLSAPFDKLGNNATVAISHIKTWCSQYGFSVRPMMQDDNTKSIIEVYPALVKSSYGASARSILDMLPSGLEKKSDAYDSAICSILGIVYGAEGGFRGLPKLREPLQLTENIKKEGWIYYVSPE